MFQPVATFTYIRQLLLASRPRRSAPSPCSLARPSQVSCSNGWRIGGEMVRLGGWSIVIFFVLSRLQAQFWCSIFQMRNTITLRAYQWLEWSCHLVVMLWSHRFTTDRPISGCRSRSSSGEVRRGETRERRNSGLVCTPTEGTYLQQTAPTLVAYEYPITVYHNRGHSYPKQQQKSNKKQKTKTKTKTRLLWQQSNE